MYFSVTSKSNLKVKSLLMINCITSSPEQAIFNVSASTSSNSESSHSPNQITSPVNNYQSTTCNKSRGSQTERSPVSSSTGGTAEARESAC